MIRYRIAIVFAAVLAAACYLGAWRAADQAPGVLDAQAGLAVPLDDVAIYLQYAKQALHGDWLRYSPGAELSTGVTSPSYFSALLLLMGLGLPGPWAAWLLGALSFLLAVVLIEALGRRLFPALPPWWGPLLLLTHGAWAGWAFNGMETGLLLALVLWCAWAALCAGPGAMLASVAALAFTRPEGQVLGVLFGMAWAWRRRQPAWTLAFAALAALPSALMVALSGGLVPDSLRAKSVLAQNGASWETLAQASRYAMGLAKGLWMGFWGAQDAVGVSGDGPTLNPAAMIYPPLLLLAALFGAFAQQQRPGAKEERGFWIAQTAGLAAIAALLSWQLPVGWHVHRYQAAAAPLLWLGALGGLDALRRQGGLGRPAAAALLLLWTAAGLASWPWHLERCYRSAFNYASGNRNAAVSLRELAPGPVAAVDAGLLAYYSGHPLVDLPGVTDHALSLASSRGKGALLEALLARPEPPRWAALHKERPDFDLEAFKSLGLLRRTPFPLAGGMELWAWNWHAAAEQARPRRLPAGATLLGELNTARLDQEAAAQYQALGPGTARTRVLNLLEAPGGAQVPEGGREVEGESFTRAGGDALILRAVFDQPGRLRVLDKEGRNLLVAAVDASPEACYSELLLPLPADAPASVILVFDGKEGQPRDWVSCHHWYVKL